MVEKLKNLAKRLQKNYYLKKKTRNLQKKQSRKQKNLRNKNYYFLQYLIKAFGTKILINIINNIILHLLMDFKERALIINKEKIKKMSY